jgi:HEAT repeat protein
MNDVNTGEAQSLGSQIKHWAEEIQEQQKRVNKKTLPAKISVGLAILFACGCFIFLGGHAWIGLVVLIAGISFGVVLFNKAAGFRNAAVQELSEDIQKELKGAKLDTDEVVEALFEKSKGKVSGAVLQALAPDTFVLLNLRSQGQKLSAQVSNRKIDPMQISVSGSSGSISAITVKGETDIDNFAGIAVDYLAHKGYVEGIAALAMVQMIYTEVAPPAGELFIHAWQGNQALKDIALHAHKIMGSFDLLPEMGLVKETLAKRRTRSILEHLLLATKQQVGQDDASLSAVIDATGLKIRDEAFVGSCVDYIGKHTHDPFKMNKAYSLLAQIPDARTLPFLMEGFDGLFFFPQGIEAVSLLRKEAQPKLFEALQKGGGSSRFNAAIALGFMNVTEAKPKLEEALPNITDPKELAGICYALVRLGDKERLNTIVDTLDHPDNNVRHAAAIALEHLSEPLGDEIYLKHLEDENMLVRLRLTRKLGIQGTTNPSVIDALIKRFDDASKEVRSAAVTTMGKLKAELVYERMVELAESGTSNKRLCALEVLGALSQPEAIPVLTRALLRTHDKEIHKTALSSLGSLNAVDAVEQIGRYLDDDDLSAAAFWALLRISLKDKTLGLKHLQKPKHKIKEFFLLSVHGDEKAKDQLKRQIHSSKEFVELAHAMEYAQILRDPDFETPLRQMLKYRNANRFPGDRYISYMALKGLVHIQMAKV